MSTEDYIENLRMTFSLREPVLRDIIRALDFPPKSHGLDVGCGLGQPAMLLVEHLDPESAITGVDISEAILAQAKVLTERRDMTGRIEFRQGSMDSLPFEANVFDWAWSVDCAGHSRSGPGKAIREVARVVRPGGRIAIIAWSSQQFLAGHPRLEARLNATSTGIAPFHHGDDPSGHFLGTAGQLYEVGIQRVAVRTFSGNVTGPVSGDNRKALSAFFNMRWGAARSEMNVSDWRLYCRLSDPDSDEFLPDRRDYYGFFTYTVFTGIVDDYTNHNRT